MGLEEIADKVVETDLLIIGGGLAGCTAAIKANEREVKATVLDKTAIRRSGGAAGGMDHLLDPTRDGVNALGALKKFCETGLYPPIPDKKSFFYDENLCYRGFKEMWDRVRELEKWGVQLRWDDGEYYWIYSTRTGAKTTLRFHGQEMKPRLAAEVRRRGIKVIEHTMGVDLLTKDGRVVGATALNIHNGDFIVCKAKAVILATGMLQRIYNQEDGAPWKNKMMYHWCPTSAGDGQAMAYRAGAELVNMEFTTWFSRLADDKTILFGGMTDGDGVPTPIVNAKGELVSPHPFMSIDKYLEQERKGLTPLYFDVPRLPEEEHKKREVAIADERPISLKFRLERGWDFRTHRWELHGTKPIALTKNLAGILIDENAKSSLNGLYAAGDLTGGNTVIGVSGAVVLGGFAAENAVDYLRKAKEPIIDESQVQRCKDWVLAPKRQEDGADPLEFEVKIRHICERYAGTLRCKGKLEEGLNRLNDLRKDWLPRLMAKNPHELMRCVDCHNLIDLAEIHLRASLMRSESRAGFYRQDYPERDTVFDGKVIVERKVNGEMTFTLKELPRLKPQYLEESKCQ